ncbi:MAG: hypothetical protein QOJ99_1877 [Bryobacterales bacterium]|nr:hypothetical protein [Bryobacterales bacterium]
MLHLFGWFDSSAVGEMIRGSTWLFPVIEAFHLLGLAVIGGAVLLVDLRLLGLGLRSQPVSRIARDAQPWLIGSLLVMLTSGTLLFTSEAVKCYCHDAFWVKMTSLFLAIIFTFTIRRKVTMAEPGQAGPLWTKMVARRPESQRRSRRRYPRV